MNPSRSTEPECSPTGTTSHSAELKVTAPANPNVAPPGYYMLFIVDGNGVPSEAEFIQLEP